jgi:hypothetical protein
MEGTQNSKACMSRHNTQTLLIKRLHRLHRLDRSLSNVVNGRSRKIEVCLNSTTQQCYSAAIDVI